jgi:hypothetical protein
MHQLRHLLLDTELGPGATTARQQLLVRIAEALLAGGTPPPAVSLLAALLQEGLAWGGGLELEAVGEQDKASREPWLGSG